MSIHNGALSRHLARALSRHLARREVSVQVRARRLREHEVVRGVAGAHPPFGPDHLRYVEPGCALVGTRPALQQPSRKTHSLFRVCVVVLSSITSRSVAAAAARSLMRFSLSSSCRGYAANPWLESAFISHVGCVSHHRWVCFPQSLVIALYVRRVSSLLCVSSWCHLSAESR